MPQFSSGGLATSCFKQHGLTDGGLWLEMRDSFFLHGDPMQKLQKRRPGQNQQCAHINHDTLSSNHSKLAGQRPKHSKASKVDISSTTFSPSCCGNFLGFAWQNQTQWCQTILAKCYMLPEWQGKHVKVQGAPPLSPPPSVSLCPCPWPLPLRRPAQLIMHTAVPSSTLQCPQLGSSGTR